MVKVRLFSLGQPRNWASTLNDTWWGGNVSVNLCVHTKWRTYDHLKWKLTVSPILRPEQDLRPGTTSPFRQVALNKRFNSSGTPSRSSSTLERIFCSAWSFHRVSDITVQQYQCSNVPNWGFPYRIGLLNELNNIPRITRQSSHGCAWNELTVLLGKQMFFFSSSKLKQIPTVTQAVQLIYLVEWHHIAGHCKN